jgi:esterase/lipase superfamily enzyme
MHDLLPHNLALGHATHTRLMKKGAANRGRLGVKSARVRLDNILKMRCIGPRYAAGCVLLLLISALARGQTVNLVRAYQDFESAKAENRVADALAYGEHAVALREIEGGDRQDLIELLRDLGEYAARMDEYQQAIHYYERALGLQEIELGPDHPDLVPLLNALAHLYGQATRYADAAATLQRALQIERASYGDRHPSVIMTLGDLRNVYVAASEAKAVADVDAQLRTAQAARRSLTAVKGNVVVRSDRYKLTKEGYATVRVFYGTNRMHVGDATSVPYYGRTEGELQFGSLNVTVPQTHKLAQLESAQEWSIFSIGVTSTENKKKYVLLESVMPLSKTEFVSSLHRSISDTSSKDVFIFVHGYNTTFEDAARRTAQLAYDMDFDGTPIMYSWPSQGTLSAYANDEVAVDISAMRLAEFIDTVLPQLDAQHLHLIAHSMGSRVLIGALQRLLLARTPIQRQHLFGQVVFTAPDVDRDYFMVTTESLRGSAERLTLYASDTDYALRLSQIFHGAPRAGAAGSSLVRLQGLDTIDMSDVPADILGHSYFAANGGAVYDLLHLLWRDDDPGSPQRCGKGEKTPGASILVWRFDAEKCKGDDLLEAAVLLKQYRDQARAQILSQISAQISALTDPLQRQAGQTILARVNQLLAPIGPASSRASQ